MLMTLLYVFMQKQLYKQLFSKAIVDLPDIPIKGERVDIVTDFKYLGVVLDPNLIFKKQV